jgi:hypothetical protein
MIPKGSILIANVCKYLIISFMQTKINFEI